MVDNKKEQERAELHRTKLFFSGVKEDFIEKLKKFFEKNFGLV